MIGRAEDNLVFVAPTISTNSTPQRITISNSRESLLIASEDDSGTSQRSRKQQRIQVAQSSLATALKEAVDEARMQRTQGNCTKQGLAIGILEEFYSDKLADDNLLKATQVLENYEKACVFTGFKAGRLGDRWLMREVKVANIS